MRKVYLNKIERTKFEIKMLDKELEMFIDKELLFQFDNFDIFKSIKRKLKRKEMLLSVLLIPKRFID